MALAVILRPPRRHSASDPRKRPVSTSAVTVSILKEFDQCNLNPLPGSVPAVESPIGAPQSNVLNVAGLRHISSRYITHRRHRFMYSSKSPRVEAFTYCSDCCLAVWAFTTSTPDASALELRNC